MKQLPDLAGVGAKTDRGFEHLQTLSDAVDRYMKRHPYGFGHRVEDEGRRHVGMLQVYLPLRLNHQVGVLIGDVAHQFRSALDHLVVGFARRHLSPERFAELERNLAFPICTDDAFWKAALGRGRLEGLPERLVAEIESRQPYRTDDPPENALLAQLQWLNDRDKHRLLVPVGAFTLPTEIGFNPPPPPGKHTLTVTPPPYTNVMTQVFELTLEEPIPNMRVYLNFVEQVFVSERPFRQDIRQTLEYIGTLIRRITYDLYETDLTT